MPVSATAIRTTLRRHGLDPAPRRQSSTWAAFLRQQGAGIVACDLFTADSIWLQQLYVLFFIELDSKFTVAQQSSLLVDHRGVVGTAMGVDPTDDNPSALGHAGVAFPLEDTGRTGTHRPGGRTHQ